MTRADQLTRREFNGALLAGFAAAFGPASPAIARPEALKLFDFAIAGGHYHGLSSALARMVTGSRLELRREPDNPHDRNAIAVYQAGLKLGYVPRAVNTPLAALMDAGRQLGADVVGFLDAQGRTPDGLAYTGFATGDPQIRLLLEAEDPRQVADAAISP